MTPQAKDGENEPREPEYPFMIILDGATKFTHAAPLDSTSDESGHNALRTLMHYMQVKPKTIVGDSAFMEPPWDKLKLYTTHDTQPVSLGPFTPWPNRAEACGRVLEKHIYYVFFHVKGDPSGESGVTTQDIGQEACWTRNVSCPHGEKTLIELVFGRRPPGVMTLENTIPGQLTTPWLMKLLIQLGVSPERATLIPGRLKTSYRILLPL